MSATLKSREPATGDLLWEGPLSVVADEVARAEASARAWAAESITNRIEIIRRVANAVRRSEEPLAELISRETGRAPWDSRAEAGDTARRIDLTVSAHSERTGQRRLEGQLGARQTLRHRPHGVMAVITPHVCPAQIPNDHIAAALIAGNAVLFKPSEKAMATGVALVELYHAAGVPDDVLRCVVGGAEAGHALVENERVNGILFTGSTQTGLAIARTASARPEKLLSLNMGSNNPIIAWGTTDLQAAAALIVQSAFGAAGQHCLAARRLIVQDILADALLREVKALADQLIIDHPLADPMPFMGPLIDIAAADDLTDNFLHLMSNGGKPIKHMQRPKDDLPFVTPGIIDVTAMTQRADTELFGPLLQVIRASSFEEAMQLANATRYGLSAALIGGSPEQYDQFCASSRASIVNWNRPTTAVPLTAPLGGTGLSGNSRPAGAYAIDSCAYPMTSAAIDVPRASIGIGLKSHHPAPAAAA